MKIRKIIRTALLGYLLTGVLLTGGATMMTGCASSPDRITLPEIAPPSSIASLEDAIAAKDAAVMREAIAIWEREQRATRKDVFTQAEAAFRIGSASEDWRWSLLSIDLFDEILDKNPDFALARAWRGSASAVYAGDYPIKGLLMVIPGPGFQRIYYVKKGQADLNAAVEAAPDDPVIRLIRASTMIGIPEVFGGEDTGIEDFAVLDGWTDDPASNPGNADLLASDEWRSQYFYNRGVAMTDLGNTTEARKAWQNLLAAADDPVDRELARWHLR